MLDTVVAICHKSKFKQTTTKKKKIKNQRATDALWACDVLYCNLMFLLVYLSIFKQVNKQNKAVLSPAASLSPVHAGPLTCLRSYTYRDAHGVIQLLTNRNKAN